MRCSGPPRHDFQRCNNQSVGALGIKSEDERADKGEERHAPALSPPPLAVKTGLKKRVDSVQYRIIGCPYLNWCDPRGSRSDSGNLYLMARPGNWPGFFCRLLRIRIFFCSQCPFHSIFAQFCNPRCGRGSSRPMRPEGFPLARPFPLARCNIVPGHFFFCARCAIIAFLTRLTGG